MTLLEEACDSLARQLISSSDEVTLTLEQAKLVFTLLEKHRQEQKHNERWLEKQKKFAAEFIDGKAITNVEPKP